MKASILTLGLISFLSSGASFAAIKGSRLTCAHARFNYTVIANLKSGEIKVIDNDSVTVASQLTELKVQITGDKIEFLNSKYSDLPATVFSATLAPNGSFKATSFDDLANGTSQYDCVLSK